MASRIGVIWLDSVHLIIALLLIIDHNKRSDGRGETDAGDKCVPLQSSRI